jgi:dUTP pyrophosphatase
MTNKISIKLKKLLNNISLPMYATEGASGMDITAGISKPVSIKPFERILIPTGFIIELPDGYEAQIRPRSGISIKHGITLVNCVGTIDADYRGEVSIPVINLSTEEYTINPGDRIAQMVISSVTKGIIDIVCEIGETQRNKGGFGSTGF